MFVSESNMVHINDLVEVISTGETIRVMAVNPKALKIIAFDKPFPTFYDMSDVSLVRRGTSSTMSLATMGRLKDFALSGYIDVPSANLVGFKI